MAAFINHSCAPNCFVQSVLSGHHDADRPRIAVFAADHIPPFTQLTWDYGNEYASSFQGGCKCGAAACISLLSAPPEEEGGEEGDVEGEEPAQADAAAAGTCAGAACCAAAP